MSTNIQKINNPLTIIAIFAALAEVNSTIALGLINPELHYIFIWFIILFPSVLVILFFITLNLNTKVMYSPSDYKEDKNFLDSLYGGNTYGIKSDNIASKVEVSEQIKNLESKFIDNIEKITTNNKNPELLKEITKLQKGLEKVTNPISTESKTKGLKLNNQLKELLLKLTSFPAYLMIIYAIIKLGAKSIEELASQKQYFLPDGWQDAGIEGLMFRGILETTSEGFKISDIFEEELREWVEINSMKLQVISSNFKKESNSDNPKYKQRIDELTERLIF